MANTIDDGENGEFGMFFHKTAVIYTKLLFYSQKFLFSPLVLSLK
jgi:hypothetical protein